MSDDSMDVRSEDEMFPDEALPDTNTPAPPRNTALDVSEVSPPNSQSQARDQVNSNGKRPLSTGMATAANNTGGGSGSASGGGGHRDADTGYQWTKQEDQPGFEWKNNRAREEESRALDSIVDKHHMIKLKYGDPLDASVAVKDPKAKR